MKKLILPLLSVGLLLSGCEKDPATDPNNPPTPPVKASISVSPRTLSFSADATDEKHTVTVTATSDEWTLEVPSDAKWIIVSETAQQSEQALDKSGRTVTVGASSNEELESRSACIYFYLEDAKDSVIVTQIGQEPAIEVAEDQYEAKAEGETLTVDVTTNVEYTVVIPEDCDWIASEIQQNGAKVALTVAENINTESRTATVTLTSEQNKVSATVTVTQAAAEERVRETDDIFIPFASAETASSASAYPVENINDNNLNTFWQTPSRGVDSPATITFDFGTTPAARIDYLVYYPSTPYGQFGEVDVYYTTGTGTETFLTSHNFGMKDAQDTIRFGETGIAGVQSVTLKVKTANGRESSTGVLAGIAELEFFRTPVLRDVLEIFTDYSCSELLPGISAEQAQHVEDSLLRSIAVGLAEGTYDKEFRVGTFYAYPHPDEDSKAFGTNTYTKWDNITGMCILEPGTYHIGMDEEPSASVYIDLINWETNCYGYNVYYQLKKGINTIVVPEKKGNYKLAPSIIYLRYHTPNYKEAKPIKVHFMDAQVNGYYDVRTMADERFETLLANAKAPEFDIIARKSILTMPVTLMTANTRTGDRAKRLMALTDTIVSLEEDLQGHIKYATGGHRNRMIFRPIYPTRDAAGNITSQGSYMYSTSYATGYNVGNDAGATICNPDKLATGIWGPAHEVGHSNQIAKGLKWAGTTEVTNNICSGYVMYTMNGGLEKNAKTSFTDREAFNNGIRDIALNPDKTLTHFAAGAWDNMFYAKAIPFWQLYLYYTYIGGYPDLYKDVYNKIRNRTDNKSISDGEAQINFVKLVSELTKTDLTEFFEFWRFLTPTQGIYISDYGRSTMTVTQAMVDEAKTFMSQFEKPKYKIQLLCEHNIRQFINPQTPVAGKMQIYPNFVRAYDFSGIVAFELCDGPDKTVAYFLPKSTTTTAAALYNRYSTLIWQDSNGNASPGNVNSYTYCYSKQQFTTIAPANFTPYVYGVTADGTRIPATNNPQ